MEAEKIYQQKFLPIAKSLLKELDYYGDNQFKKVTLASDWTIGQLYHHLIQGTYDYHFKAVRNCLGNTGGDLKGSKTFVGYFVFWNNRFPPFKINGALNYVPTQIESPLKAKDMMFGFIKEMHKLAQEIDKKPKHKYKVKHRKFGRLTAIEWYALIEIHISHHLKQKSAIDKILRKFVKDEVYEGNSQLV